MNTIKRLACAMCVVVLAAELSGCALTSKSDSVILRYFSADATHAHTTGAANDAVAKSAGLALRIGRVNASSYLKDKIAYRTSAYEVGYYEELRWTEKPEAYVRRALRGAFFEEHGVRQIVSGPGTTLEVELNAFEELKEPRRAARVGVTWVLRDDLLVLVQETFVVERPLGGADGAGAKGADEAPAAFAAAMADALDDAVRRIVSRALATMTTSPREEALPPGTGAP